MFKIVSLLCILGFASALDLSKVRRIELLIPPGVHASTEPDERIINGDYAELGQFPYQALVLSYYEDEGSGLCGGTLISQNYVLTAAHCVDYEMRATNGTVYLGITDRIWEEESQQQIEFSSFHVHPEWDLATIRYDVATIELATPATFNEYVQPVELPALSEARTFAGIIGTISGFGRTNDIPGSSASYYLRFTRNPILTNANCQAQLGAFPLAPQHICFAGAGSRSACHGDSGGPLTVLEDGRTVQVGVASFVAGGLCTVGVPTGYVRVTYFLDWIAENSDVVLRA